MSIKPRVIDGLFDKLDLKSREKTLIDVINIAPITDIQDILLIVQEMLATRDYGFPDVEFNFLHKLDNLREKLFSALYSRNSNEAESLLRQIKTHLTTNIDVLLNGQNEVGEILIKMQTVRAEASARRKQLIIFVVVIAVNFGLTILGNFAANFL